GDLHGRRGPGDLRVRLPAVDDGDAALDDVVEVEREHAVLLRGQQLEQVDDVGAVELRGLRGQATGEVGVAEDRDAVLGDDPLVGHGAGGVAAVGRGHVDDHGAVLHPGDRLGGDQAGGRASGDQRGRDDDVGG